MEGEEDKEGPQEGGGGKEEEGIRGKRGRKKEEGGRDWEYHCLICFDENKKLFIAQNKSGSEFQ